jgi:hypothetical protein
MAAAAAVSAAAKAECTVRPGYRHCSPPAREDPGAADHHQEVVAALAAIAALFDSAGPHGYHPHGHPHQAR